MYINDNDNDNDNDNNNNKQTFLPDQSTSSQMFFLCFILFTFWRKFFSTEATSSEYLFLTNTNPAPIKTG